MPLVFTCFHLCAPAGQPRIVRHEEENYGVPEYRNLYRSATMGTVRFPVLRPSFPLFASYFQFTAYSRHPVRF